MMRKSRKNYLKAFLIFWWRKAREMLGLQFCDLTGLIRLKSNCLSIHIYSVFSFSGSNR